MSQTAITPTRAANFPEWYQQVIKAADMAENSSVRGCMIIKPWGYGLWETIQRILDRRFKETGHKNAYFPLFIPLSLLSKEAEHVDGFATESAVVTHHRLKKGADGKLHPDGELEEPLVVRPTSEMIIMEAYARWVQSYRDLPLLINQWANVVRWEMRTRLFLRTAEFLWQEGHTAHATAEEAETETLTMLDVYADFMRNCMAMPVIKGRKTPAERFPGAEETYTVEAMMQDGKALQAGTSHFLGQNFAKAAGIQFLDKDGQQKHVWTTSWGVSTRMIGGLIMTHSDDDGLVLPPRVAPSHVVLLPILKGGEADAAVLKMCDDIKARLSQVAYHGRVVEVEIDTREMNAGERKWEWVKKGIPLRIEVGPKDVESGKVPVSRRDRDAKDKTFAAVDELVGGIVALLDDIQSSLYQRALALRDERLQVITSEDDFRAYFAGEGAKGFALCAWAGDEALEKQLKSELQVTTRCLPLAGELPHEVGGTCIFTGKPGELVVFGKAY
ncbi:MAG: proline--tRNA ligase [Pseudomonadaceae bacterium]|nr:proline--tRNA ligase [Pseudomonadaceae bacterium]